MAVERPLRAAVYSEFVEFVLFCIIGRSRKVETEMNIQVNLVFGGLLALIATVGCALAQSPTGAEARLKEKNIILPQVPPPVANYVDFVQSGKLLFLAGNTAGAQWKFKGKVGKDITIDEGVETARQVGLIMLAKVRAATGNLDRVKRVVKSLGWSTPLTDLETSHGS
jgi:enamine deaminase RidA (YjgF/YER057c/UK114 family)